MPIVDFPQDLIEAFVDDQVLGVIGAGLSIRAGLPSWKSLMSMMIEECERNVIGFSDATEFRSMLELGKLPDVAGACRDTLGNHLYERFLVRKLGDEKIRPIDAHRALLQLPFAGLLTTNFDSLLETAYNEGRLDMTNLKPHHQENLSFLSGSASERKFFILKLHGDIREPRTLVLTTSDYKRLMDPRDAYSHALSALISTKTLLFTGYSLQDDDVRNVLAEIATAFQLRGRRHFALLADPGAYLTKTLSKDYNVHVIPYSAANEHAELLQLLGRLRDSVTKHRNQFGPRSKESWEARRFPYKFLDFYDTADRDLFFGREEEVQQLAARVGAHRPEGPGRPTED